MSHKDTLKLYDDLLAGGCTEAQARVQAEQLGSMGSFLEAAVNKLGENIDHLNDKMDKISERTDRRMDKIDADMFWMRAIGAAMTFAFFSNAFWK